MILLTFSEPQSQGCLGSPGTLGVLPCPAGCGRPQEAARLHFCGHSCAHQPGLDSGALHRRLRAILTGFLT